MTKTKILHIYKNYYPESVGGVERCIYSLARGLENLSRSAQSDELGHQEIQSDLLTTTRSNKMIERKIGSSQVFYFPSTITLASTPISLSMLKNFKEMTRSYDILHYHFPWPFADMMQLISGIDKPIVTTYHSDIVKQKWLRLFYTPLMHRFLKRADRIIATSENYVKTSPVLNHYASKTTAIPLGIDRDEIPSLNDKVLSKWKEKVGSDFFLFIGVLRYYKGLEFLLEAVKDTKIPLVIAGDGSEEKRLKEIANKYKLQNVTFVGQVDDNDKTALLTLCKSVVAPSHLRSEAFCLALLEGLIFGKPLISTEIGTGTSFVNQHDLSGLVVPPENPKALREAMERLTTDSELYDRLQKGTQIHYKNHFTGRSMAIAYAKIYDEILSSDMSRLNRMI